MYTWNKGLTLRDEGGGKDLRIQQKTRMLLWRCHERRQRTFILESDDSNDEPKEVPSKLKLHGWNIYNYLPPWLKFLLLKETNVSLYFNTYV